MRFDFNILAKTIGIIGNVRMGIYTLNFIKQFTADFNFKKQYFSGIKRVFRNFLDIISSPGIGTVLTIISALLFLTSPLGIVWGATLCSVAIVGHSITVVRDTLRMQTIRDTQNKNTILDRLNDTVKHTPESSQNPELASISRDKIYNIIKLKITDNEKIEEKKLHNKLSGMLRYLNVTSAWNWGLSIASFNPVSIAVSSFNMLFNNGFACYEELSYRDAKDKLDREVSDKEGEVKKWLKKEFGVEDKFISQLDKKDLVGILNIKEAELLTLPKKDMDNISISTEFEKNLQQCVDADKKQYKSSSFLGDFGHLFICSFHSKYYYEYFTPMPSRTKTATIALTDKGDVMKSEEPLLQQLPKQKQYHTQRISSKKNIGYYAKKVHGDGDLAPSVLR
jgi:hypothetical protein